MSRQLAVGGADDTGAGFLARVSCQLAVGGADDTGAGCWARVSRQLAVGGAADTGAGCWARVSLQLAVGGAADTGAGCWARVSRQLAVGGAANTGGEGTNLRGCGTQTRDDISPFSCLAFSIDPQPELCERTYDKVGRACNLQCYRHHRQHSCNMHATLQTTC